MSILSSRDILKRVSSYLVCVLRSLSAYRKALLGALNLRLHLSSLSYVLIVRAAFITVDKVSTTAYENCVDYPTE
jgi:hypothetical protein